MDSQRLQERQNVENLSFIKPQTEEEQEEEDEEEEEEEDVTMVDDIKSNPIKLS